ncbi:MAG: hypothetical protein AVDCRST_MAG35-523, partial [uncultured Quadrisphaera sp.]
ERPDHAQRPEHPLPGPGVPRAAAGQGRARAPDEPEARPRGGLLRRSRPPRGAHGAGHRRRLRHRPRGGHRLRPRGRRPGADPPARGAGRRRRGGRPGRGRRAEGRRRARRPRGRGVQHRAGAPGRRGAGAARRPGAQRRAPGRRGVDLRPQLRAVRPDDEDQRVQPVLDGEGRPAARARGRVDHHDVLGAGLQPVADAAGLRHHQGGDQHVHQGPGPAGGPAGDPRERRRARAVLDAPAGRRRAAGREGADLRRAVAVRPAGAARGDRQHLRAPGLRGVQLHLGLHAVGDRRDADAL